ncbi:hypothetical protein CCYS_10265 [Corynebacterium cystitidis DSM 20524]|uniref:Uncharacterized protein n=1 Tax=Corynebacterium cystitidis DSM 20524 TaxID=1121357 RepID=A0A1H9WBU3_9CORY|nr:hypothetical protein CCYS_10265 [Corynebacterium cystitidis DSM 20524]SES31137.1 hypothetical protein SAMN05661109_02646 [Corynebacterium cystitidis DSM 20524]SNV68123.1 Uncharacterised protein [Corynebacterium cystitidis]
MGNDAPCTMQTTTNPTVMSIPLEYSNNLKSTKNMEFDLRSAVFDQGSPARNGQYLAHANGNKFLAASLYEWNAELSASFSKDLAFVEVSLRQKIDTALREWNRQGEPGATWRWIDRPRGDLAALDPQR